MKNKIIVLLIMAMIMPVNLSATADGTFYITEPASGTPANGSDPIVAGSSAFDRIKAVNYSKQRNAGKVEDCYDNSDLV